MSELVAEKVFELIRNGSLKPGDRLPTEHELVQQLGVGRTSVREAMQRLKALGLISVQRGRGVFVAEPSAEDAHASFLRWSVTNRFAIEHLVESRMALESMAAALAAVRGSDEQVATLEQAHDAHVEASRQSDLGVLVTTDLAFHDAVMTASGNLLLAKQCAMVNPELYEFRRHTLAMDGWETRSVAGHAAVLAAIQQHDGDRARSAMLDHLFWMYEAVENAYRTDDAAGGAPRHVAPRSALG